MTDEQVRLIAQLDSLIATTKPGMPVPKSELIRRVLMSARSAVLLLAAELEQQKTPKD